MSTQTVDSTYFGEVGSRFGEYLVSEGKLTRPQVEKAIEIQNLAGGRLGTNLLDIGLLREESLLSALGTFRQSATASAYDLAHVPPELARLVPPKIARRHKIVPIEQKGRTLILASMDSGDPFVEDEVGMLTSCLARTVIGLELRIELALARYYGMPMPTRLVGLARRLQSRAKAPAAPAPQPPAAQPPPSAPAPRPIPRPAPAEKAKEPEPPPEPPQVQYVELKTEDLAQLYGKSVEEIELPTEPPPPVDPSALGGDGAFAAFHVNPIAALKSAQTAEARLHAAATALQHTDIRDEIGDVLLTFGAPFLKRRAIFIQRKDQILGWRAEGDGISEERVRAISISSQEPSVFLGLNESASFWLAPLPPLPANQRLLHGFGGAPPRDSLVLPVVLRSRVVCFLYADNGASDTSVASAPMPELRRLVGKAGLAFEVYILKNKIRTL